jgi:DNA-binding transcriptional LysR family regulator
MEFRDLRYLEVLAAELHFGRAATRLHMTQPALSQALARLEKEIGCPLMQRDHRGASLTAAGRVLLAETQGISSTMSTACELSRRAGRGDTGTVTVGFLDAAVFDVLPPLLRTFQRLYPAVDVTARQLKSAELSRGVEVGQLDLAFLRRELPPPGVEFLTLRSEPLVLAVSRNHRLAGARDVSVRELTDEAWVMPALEGVPSLHAMWLDICYAAMFTPKIAAHISSIQVLIELVAQEVGIAFVAERWVQGNPNVVLKPMRDVDQYLELAIAFRPTQLSSTAKNFLDLVLSHPSVAMADAAAHATFPITA